MTISKTWYAYILRCADDTLYTGCTNDLTVRLKNHNAGNGSKYTRVRLPVELVYQEQCENRSEAQKRESEIKKLKRSEKLNLI